MSRIFLSHSSADEFEAVALRQWLADNGWDDVFLDVDPDRGLAPGDRWQDALRRAADRCEAVVFVVSPAWATSKWCLAEFLLAKNLNKLIFGVVLKPVSIGELPTEMTAEWQLCQLVGEGPTESIRFTHRGTSAEISLLADGLNRLRSGLQGAGLSANYFPWPPKGDESRSPYRGLEPLDAPDAAVFFGRDAEILQGLDILRGMRAAGDQGLLVILGASGAGKSSFLRAGLLPRLARDDRHFAPLPIVRPERSPVSGDRGLVAALAQAHAAVRLDAINPGDVEAALARGVEQFAALLRRIQNGAQSRLIETPGDAAPPTLVLPVDQAEELFSADATQETHAFLDLIGNLLRAAIADPRMERRVPLIVVFTIRSDRYEPLQTAPELAGLKTVVFDALRPMPPAQFKEIITGPANRGIAHGRAVEFKPDLVRQLLADCAQGADTLPLLSLTLARLYTKFGADGDLRLDEYQRMGGMADVINTEAESVLARDPEQRRAQLDLLHAAFIPWLATINADDDQPARRIARLADLPPASAPLVQALIARRLLLSDARNGETVIEVAHESLLRQWNTLADWLRVERDDLKEADRLEQAVGAWTKSGRKADWLIEGERLATAEALAAKPSYRKRLEPAADFLVASRQREAHRVAEEARARQMELDAARERQAAAESLAIEQQRAAARAEADAARLRSRGRQLIGLLAVAAVVAVAAVWFAVQSNRQSTLATRQFTQATALRINSEAQGMLSGARGGGIVLGLLKLLAAHSLASNTEIEGSLLAAVLAHPQLEKILDSESSPVAVAFTPDGTRIVSTHADATVRVWDVKTGQPVGEPLRGHERVAATIAFSPDGRRMITVSDSTPRLWDAKTLQLIAPLRGHQDRVAQLAFTPDGTRIVTGSFDRTLRIWNGVTGQPIGAPLKGHDNSVLVVAFSPDGTRIASGGADATLRLWDANSGEPIGALMRTRGAVDSVVFSPDGRLIASVDRGYDTRVWEAASGRQVGSVIRAGEVTSVVFNDDGSQIVTTDLNRNVRVWEALSGQLALVDAPTHTYDRRAERFGFASMLAGERDYQTPAFSPDGTRMISEGTDGTLRLWNANGGFPVVDTQQGEVGSSVRVAFSPDGRHFVSASDDSSLRLWDVASLQPIGKPMTGHSGGVIGVAYSPDGTRIVSGGYDGTVRLWDATSGRAIGAVKGGHEKLVKGVAYSPDGKHIVSGAEDGTLRLWDAASGAPISAWKTGDEFGVQCVVFSPDGKRIVSGGDKTLRQWDAATGHPIGSSLTGHTSRVRSVAYSPDGTRILSGGDDQTLRLWDANTGTPIGTPMVGHTNPVLSVAFSPDGTRIVSGSNDQTLRFWDAASGRSIGGPIKGHAGLVGSVAFSPDGTRIISSSDDVTVRLWPAPSRWSETLCARLTRNMSRKEWRESISPDIEYRVQCEGLPVPPDAAAEPPK